MTRFLNETGYGRIPIAGISLILALTIPPMGLCQQTGAQVAAQNTPRVPAVPGLPTSPAPQETDQPAIPDTGFGALLGATVSWQYYAFGGPFSTGGTFRVNGAVGGTFEDYFNIIGDGNSFTFNYNIPDEHPGTWGVSALSLPPTIHNGIAINLLDGPPVLALRIDSATNMAGFDASRISFTSNQIQVDWEGLTFTPSTIVKLDVITPNSSFCLQDQYGDQYHFTLDANLGYVYGNATELVCSNPIWSLIGSFVSTPTGLDLVLTAANQIPNGNCVPLFSLSGKFPNFEWLYLNGQEDPQRSSYVECGTTKLQNAVPGQGPLK